MGATQLAKRFLTKDGRWVWVRLLRPKDAGHLVDLFDHMGAESRYRRFHQSMDNVPTAQVWDEAERIATAVLEEQLGLIALTTNEYDEEIAVGAARIVWLNENTAEFAMSVRDDFQGQGVGKRLLAMILEMAHTLGAETVVGTILNDNAPILHLFRQLPYPIQRHIDGTESEIVIDLLGEKMGV